MVLPIYSIAPEKSSTFVIGRANIDLAMAEPVLFAQYAHIHDGRLGSSKMTKVEHVSLIGSSRQVVEPRGWVGPIGGKRVPSSHYDS
jgi:hypothetical protein